MDSPYGAAANCFFPKKILDSLPSLILQYYKYETSLSQPFKWREKSSYLF